MSTTIGWPASSPLAIHIPFHISAKAIFFITLKGAKRAGWNEECDQAFMAIKQYLTEPPIWLAQGQVIYTLSLLSNVRSLNKCSFV